SPATSSAARPETKRAASSARAIPFSLKLAVAAPSVATPFKNDRRVNIIRLLFFQVQSVIADLECGGGHGNDRDNNRQRSLHTSTDHLLFSDESPPRAVASAYPTTRSLIKPRSLPLAAPIRGLI